MSTITFLHDVHSSSIKDGKKLTDEEKIIDGEKGLTIKYFHKDDSSTEKIVIMGKNDSFTMKTIINGDKDEKNLSKSELMKELKSKKLKFALDYFKGQEGGKIVVKRETKKGSKSSKKSKVSKKSKASKKTVKKTVKK